MQKTPEHLTCRAALPSDEPLLYEIFAADRAREFDALWLSADQVAVLLELQFRARQAGYEREFPGAANRMVCLQDGTPVGYYRLARNPDGYRLVDLAVVPQVRNRGIGRWALRRLQQRCAAEHASLSLRVLRGNPALSLYRRLCFTCVSSDAISLEMTWAPPLHCGRESHASTMTAAPGTRAEQVLLLHANPTSATGYNLQEVLFVH